MVFPLPLPFFSSLSFAFPLPSIFPTFVNHSADMQSGPSYSTQSPNMHVASDHSLPSFYRDVAYSRQQQEYDPSHMLYIAASRHSSDSECVLYQSRTAPPLTYSRPMILSEHDLHYLNRSTRISALSRPLETLGVRDSTPCARYVVDSAESPGAFMPLQAHDFPRRLASMHPDWNDQDIGIDDSVDGSGRTPTVPAFKPPFGICSTSIYDTIQVGSPTLTTEYDLRTLGGHRGHPEGQSFYDPNELPFSPSGHVPTRRFPTPTCPPNLLNTIDKTKMNVGAGPVSVCYAAPQAGHGANHEWAGRNYYGSGNMASSLPCSDESWRQQPHSFHRLHHRHIGNLSMHGGSPEVDLSHSGPSADVPRNLAARDRCGWRDNSGRECGAPITYDNLAHHFAAFHGIRNLASDVEITCCWCPPGKMVKRENLLRHLREHHLGYQRPKKGVSQASLQFPSVTHAHRAFSAGKPVESRTFVFSYPPHGPSPTHTRSPRSRDFPTSGFPVDILPQSSWNQNG